MPEVPESHKNYWKVCLPSVQLNPEDHGWTISGGQYEVDWFKGNQLPESVVDLLTSLDDNGEEVDTYSGAESDSDNEDDGESGEDEDCS